MTELAVTATATPPGPPRPGLIERARQLLTPADQLAQLAEFAESYDDIAYWKVNGRGFAMIRRPEDVERVLVAGHDRYIKAAHYRLLATVTGQGLLTNEGDSWASQRRLMQPMFTRQRLNVLAHHMRSAIDERLDTWHDDGTTVDVAELMSEMALDVVGRALFSTSLGDAADRLRPAVVTGLRTAVRAARLQLALTLPRGVIDLAGRALFHAPLLPPPLHKIRAAMRTIDDVVNEIIDQRHSRRSDETGDDLLDLLLAARDERGEPMSRRQIRDELVTLMLAGHETTANGLAWMWHLLAYHPDARDRLATEVDTVLDGHAPDAERAEQLVWTRACFQEAMRLYPPAWILERETVTDDELADYLIPKRTTVLIPVYLIHRDPRWWPDPESYVPSRFLPGVDHPRGTYLPFGAGRRICIGAAFALLEATLITAMVTQRYTLEPLPAPTIEPEATVTLRPKQGLPMTVTLRA